MRLSHTPLVPPNPLSAEYYVHRGLALGVAKYVATGRDLATQRVNFINTYTRYSHSHLAPAVNMMLLLLITFKYNAMGLGFYIEATQSLWLVAISWLLAPALYNPSAFSIEEIRSDYLAWSAWLRSPAFEENFYGHTASNFATGSLSQDNWFSWLNVEPLAVKLPRALLRLVIYTGIGFSIIGRIISFPAFEVHTGRTMTRIGVQVAVLLVLLAIAIASTRVKRRVVELAAFYALLAFGGVAMYLAAHGHVFDAAFQFTLCVATLTNAAGALLELAVLGWSASSASAAETRLLWPTARLGPSGPRRR